jgi:putative membrane protein
MRSANLLLASLGALALSACNSEPAGNTSAADGTAAGDTAAADTGATGTGGANTMETPAAGAAATTAQGFADSAAASDMFEIESSKLANTMAKSADVKSFAQMMITDHTKSSAELKAAAGKATPAVTPAPKLAPDQQASLDSLKSAGANFDKTYAQAQVDAHQKTLSLLQGYASAGDSEPLKAFASKTAPVVSQHLEKARTLAK